MNSGLNVSTVKIRCVGDCFRIKLISSSVDASIQCRSSIIRRSGCFFALISNVDINTSTVLCLFLSAVKGSGAYLSSNGIVNMKISGSQKDLDLVLFDINGRVIHSENVNSSRQDINKQLDLSRFPKGVYLVHLSNSEQSLVSKIILV